MRKSLPIIATFCLLAGPAHGLSLNESCIISSESSLGANFSGHDVKALYRQLSSAGPKSEYESSAEFERRMQGALDSFPSAVKDGPLCVVGQTHFISSTYDAESQVLTVRALSTYGNQRVQNGELVRYAAVYGGEEGRIDSSYMATNAYGASVRVSKLVRDAYYVSFDRSRVEQAAKRKGISFNAATLSVEIPLSGGDAQLLRPNLDVAYIYRVGVPYTAMRTRYKTPKIDDPTDHEERQFFVTGDLYGIAIFNRETGEVVTVFDGL